VRTCSLPFFFAASVAPRAHSSRAGCRVRKSVEISPARWSCTIIPWAPWVRGPALSGWRTSGRLVQPAVGVSPRCLERSRAYGFATVAIHGLAALLLRSPFCGRRPPIRSWLAWLAFCANDRAGDFLDDSQTQDARRRSSNRSRSEPFARARPHFAFDRSRRLRLPGHRRHRQVVR
jgi:hypothetical protein